MKRQPTYTASDVDMTDMYGTDLQRLAADWHGGQFTALYALASTGSLELYPGEGLGRLIRELGECLAIAERDELWGDARTLAVFLDWCTAHHAPDNDS